MLSSCGNRYSEPPTIFSHTSSLFFLLPLWHPSRPSAARTTQIFIRHSLQQLLGGAFPHLSAHDVGRFVEGLFALNQNPEAFRMHLRDFLIQVPGCLLAKDESHSYSHQQLPVIVTSFLPKMTLSVQYQRHCFFFKNTVIVKNRVLTSLVFSHPRFCGACIRISAPSVQRVQRRRRRGLGSVS